MDARKAQWDKPTYYALGLHKRWTRMLGTWPLDDDGIFSVLKNFITVIIPIIVVIIFVYNSINKGFCGSIVELVDIIGFVTGCLSATMKIIFLRRHQKSLSHIVSSAVEDWMNIDDKKSRDLMLEYAFMGRVVFILQMIGAYLVILPIFLTRPPSIFIDNESHNMSIPLRNVPMGPKCWISLETSMFVYLLYYTVIAMGVLIIPTPYMVPDVFSFGLAMHICGQFELLYRSLRVFDNDISEQMQREEVSRFSKRHTHLLSLMNDFEEAFSMSIFFEIGSNTIVIAVSEIMVLWASKIGDNGVMIMMIIRTYIPYGQIFVQSFVGEKLSSNAGKLQVAIYDRPWYNMKPNIVKDFRFIMMRNNYEFHFTAGKVCNMDYENFKNIFKAIFSYFSILRLMFDG